jgi:hypothetical protein
MNRVFDYNGTIVAPSNPVKKLKTVKKMLSIDSGDRDLVKYTKNGNFVVYLPRVYENVISIRLAAAELPGEDPLTEGPGVGGSKDYLLLDIEGLNKMDECSIGADRSGFPDGYFAKIPVTYANTGSQVQQYNDNSAQENIGYYSPAIGKLDRMQIRMRYHSQKATSGYVYWIKEYSLTFELEMLDNSFDDFSQFETRVSERA